MMHATLAGRLARGLVLLAPLMLHPAAGAQDRPKVKVMLNTQWSPSVDSVAFSPDGTRLLSASFEMRLWDAATGTLIRSFERDFGAVRSVAFSPDGSRVLSGHYTKTVKLWDATTGALLRTFEGHSHAVSSVAFSPDGTRVLSGSFDDTVRLWDAATGALLRTLEGNSMWRVSSVAFSPDGAHVLSGSFDKEVKKLRLWDAATGALLRTFEGHSGEVLAVAFSPDGGRVLSGAGYWDVLSRAGGDLTLRLWDAASGTLLRTFKGHSDQVQAVAFSPDGARVLSGSSDRTVKLWDAATGALLRTFEGHSSSVKSVAFSPDGRRILSGGDGTVRIWDAASGALLTTLMVWRDGSMRTERQWLAVTPSGFFAASKEGTEMRTEMLSFGLSIVRGPNRYPVMQFYDELHRPDLVAELLKGDPQGKYRDAAGRLESILDLRLPR